MRSCARLAVVVLLALLGLGLPAPAQAATPTLTVTPPSGPAGTRVTLRYDGHTDPQTCPPATAGDDQVRFAEGTLVLGSRPFNPNTCTAQLVVALPSSGSGATCGPHALTATPRFAAQGFDDVANAATATFTVTCATPTVTVPPRPSRTPSPTASSTPSPTASPTASPTPSSTPTPTPTRVLATSSAQPVVAVEPPDLSGPSGSSGTPWYVGGAALGLVAVAGSWFLVRPKAGTPVAAGVAVAGVAAGVGLLLLAPSDPPTPVVLGSYVAGPGGGCAAGDAPLTGGFHVLDVPPQLLHHEPKGSSSDTGWWDASAAGTSESSTLCLRFGTKVTWRVRSAALAGSPARAGVSCQTTEQLLGGGFYVPWGLAGPEGTHPEPPARWAVLTGAEPADLPPIRATASALCAELPDGVRTYSVTGSGASGGAATARCYPGDAVLGGGYAGTAVRGSHPVDGGWQVELGAGTGSAYALCYHPSRALGLRASHVQQASVSGEYQATAECGAGEALLGGGWTTGHGIGAMQHFRPEGTRWVVALPAPGDVTAYALCARRW